jgi:hypothetical protein
MKFLRTIRLDQSDTFIFPAAAQPGEWAIPGVFVFSDIDPATLQGKDRSAFRSGFLGIPSLGWSTLVQIVETDADTRVKAIDMLAKCLMDRFDAPDLAAARMAATEEIDFAGSLCNHPPDTLIAVHRVYEEGATRETFRALRARGGLRPSRVFSFLEVEDEQEEPDESVELTILARGDRA